MSQLLDPYSPQTPITADGKLAGNWFQRWLSRLQDAIDPYYQQFNPVLTGATLISSPNVQWRDRGKTFELSLDINVTVPTPVSLITIQSPVQLPAFGCAAGAVTQDLHNYRMINGLYFAGPPAQFYLRLYDGSNFGAGFQNITLGGFFQFGPTV